ncbi:MAG: OB-fold domain-containing protein [Thermodesulfobacteriota bacterium]
MSKQVPFKDGLLTEPLSPLEGVRLRGIKCRSCGSMAPGTRKYCINCTSSELEEIAFSKYGVVRMHTIVRHSPPPPYPKDKFKPFPAAWVQLEDGLYILSELTDIGLEDVKTGMKVEMVAQKGWEDANGDDVIMYKFRPRS